MKVLNVDIFGDIRRHLKKITAARMGDILFLMPLLVFCKGQDLNARETYDSISQMLTGFWHSIASRLIDILNTPRWWSVWSYSKIANI